jgi:undecaprenyl pyrophosphate phosphatase UppP
MAGASALQGRRALRSGVPPRLRRSLFAGLASAFGSTLLSAALLRGSLSESPLLPSALYRCMLAVAVLARARRSG